MKMRKRDDILWISDAAHRSYLAFLDLILLLAFFGSQVDELGFVFVLYSTYKIPSIHYN
jgi:hypothetical protein